VYPAPLRSFAWGALLLLTLLPAGFLSGQATEGTILGTVTDNSTAVVPDAQITVTNLDTNFARTTRTNGDGEYVVPDLPIGHYTVTAEKSGFKKAMVPPVEMNLKARVRADLQLQIGETSQTIEVTGAAALLKTDSPEVSTLITQEQLQSLPSHNRHFLGMAVLTPGVYMQWQGVNDRIGDFSGGASLGVNGLGSGQNNFILDGVSDNLELTGGLNAVPPIDAIREVSVQTNAYSAEFGRAGGSVVNIAMKSGTNQIHGFGYDYIQNDKFNARPYDFTGTNPAKQPLRQNLFGGGISGPIIRNRVFLFADYEGLRKPSTALEYDTTPTALEKKGDFSQSGWTVYDPATQDKNGNRQPFAGNIIPQSRINTKFQELLSIFPDPDYKDPNPTILTNYLAHDVNKDTRNTYTFKGDEVLSSRDTMSMRFQNQLFNLDRSGWITDSAIGAKGTLNGTNAGWTYTHIFTPNLVNEARAGWNYVNDGNAPFNNTILPGLSDIPGGIPNPGFPAFSIRNISSTKAVRALRTLPNPYIVWQNSLQFMDNVSWHHGNHAVKAGVEYIHHRSDVGGGGAAGGFKFSIDGFAVVSSPTAKRPSNMTGTPEFLLGLASQITTYNYYDKNRLRDNRFSAFVQADWRLTPKLSLSLGLRYEYFPAFHFALDRGVNFDLTTGTVLVPESGRSFVQNVLGLPNGDLPPNYKYVPSDRVKPHSDSIDLSPRVGFAYTFNPRIVVRGGYGIFYTPTNTLQVNNLSGAPFSFQMQVTGDAADPVVITNGFPTGGLYNELASTDIGPTQYQSHYLDPYVQKYGVNVQYQALKKTVVEAGFEGNHAIRLDVGTRLNYPKPGPGDIQSRRPYPLSGEGFGDEQRGYSHYNALNIIVRQQVSHGLQIYGQGTIQHSYGNAGYIDPYNWDYSRGTLSQDTAHQLSASVIYDTPGLRSQPWLMRKALGGWQVSSIVALQGGLPFSVNSAQTMNDDVDSSRADYITSNGPAALPNSQRTINRWFNTAAFVTPANYTWGNSGLNILRGPGKAELQLAVQKSFSVRERANLIFRAEAQNAFNRVNLGMPSATVDSAAYGTIRSLGGDPRLMQMMMKITF
jgi:hypothetical protein